MVIMEETSRPREGFHRSLVGILDQSQIFRGRTLEAGNITESANNTISHIGDQPTFYDFPLWCIACRVSLFNLLMIKFFC